MRLSLRGARGSGYTRGYTITNIVCDKRVKSTACAKIEIFRTNRCPELQTHSKETGPTRHALQSPSQHRRSSFWTLTQPIRPSTSLKLAQTDPKWPPRDRAIWRATGVQDRNHELVGTRSGGRAPTMCAHACAVTSCPQTTTLEAT